LSVDKTLTLAITSGASSGPPRGRLSLV